MATGAPDHYQKTIMQVLNGDTLRDIKVDANGKIEAIAIGKDGDDDVALALDADGNLEVSATIDEVNIDSIHTGNYFGDPAIIVSDNVLVSAGQRKLLMGTAGRGQILAGFVMECNATDVRNSYLEIRIDGASDFKKSFAYMDDNHMYSDNDGLIYLDFIDEVRQGYAHARKQIIGKMWAYKSSLYVYFKNGNAVDTHIWSTISYTRN